MTIKDRRKYRRYDFKNLVTFISTDEHGNELSQRIGETVNLSMEGMLISTTLPIGSDYVFILSIDSQQDMVDIKCRVVHSKTDENGRYKTGLQFLDEPESVKRKIKDLIKAYDIQENRINIKDTAT